MGPQGKALTALLLSLTVGFGALAPPLPFFRCAMMGVRLDDACCLFGPAASLRDAEPELPAVAPRCCEREAAQKAFSAAPSPRHNLFAAGPPASPTTIAILDGGRAALRPSPRQLSPPLSGLASRQSIVIRI